MMKLLCPGGGFGLVRAPSSDNWVHPISGSDSSSLYFEMGMGQHWMPQAWFTSNSEQWIFEWSEILTHTQNTQSLGQNSCFCCSKSQVLLVISRFGSWKCLFFADQTPFFAPLGWHSAPHEASAFPTKHWQSSRTRFAKLHLRPVIDWMKYHKSVCQEETRRNNKAWALLEICMSIFINHVFISFGESIEFKLKSILESNIPASQQPNSSTFMAAVPSSRNKARSKAPSCLAAKKPKTWSCQDYLWEILKKKMQESILFFAVSRGSCKGSFFLWARIKRT